eukprot:40223-Chlamydomonas_euryale.AAC.2
MHAFYDLAADVIAENPQYVSKLLSPDLQEYLQSAIVMSASPEEAYRRYDALGARHTEVLRRLTKQIQVWAQAGVWTRGGWGGAPVVRRAGRAADQADRGVGSNEGGYARGILFVQSGGEGVRGTPQGVADAGVAPDFCYQESLSCLPSHAECHDAKAMK